MDGDRGTGGAALNHDRSTSVVSKRHLRILMRRQHD